MLNNAMLLPLLLLLLSALLLLPFVTLFQLFAAFVLREFPVSNLQSSSCSATSCLPICCWMLTMPLQLPPLLLTIPQLPCRLPQKLSRSRAGSPSLRTATSTMSLIVVQAGRAQPQAELPPARARMS